MPLYPRRAPHPLGERLPPCASRRVVTPRPLALPLAALLAALLATGCGGEQEGGEQEGGEQEGGAGGAGGAGLPSYPAGVRNHCRSNPVSAPNALCASVLLPADLPGAPVQVSFHFFAQLPPMGPPTRFGVEIKDAAALAEFRAGYEVPITLTNAPSSGDYHPYVVLYFEGGGALTWIPVPGVDYVGQLAGGMPLTFTGDAVNLEEPLAAERVE